MKHDRTKPNKRIFNTVEFFQDFANNYLSTELIAEHNRITNKEAILLINEGRKVQNGLKGSKNVQLNANVLY